MPLNIVELAIQVERAIRDELSDKEVRRLGRELWNKFDSDNTSLGPKEVTVLTGITRYPTNRSNRKKYIDRGLQQWSNQDKKS